MASVSAPVANLRLETLRSFLIAQSGLDAAAADVLIRNHWAPSTNSGLDSIWSQWLRHCKSASISFTDPSIGQFINFLQAISSGTYRSGDQTGVATSAGWVRSVRSGISSMLALMTATPRLGEHPLVTAYISSVIKQDVLQRGKPGVRYDDTWDATLIFDYWMSQPETSDLAFPALLDKAISLSRIHMCSRSADLATLWFGSRVGGETVRFHFGASGSLDAVSIRFFNPKTGRYMSNAHGFTSWQEFPVTTEFPAEVQLAPVLLALYDMVKLRGDFHPTPAVFLATRRSASVVEGNRLLFFEGLTADRLASRMKVVMTNSGVPSDFNPHSARSAGGALLEVQGRSDDAIMDCMRLRSKYIYRKHYKRGTSPVATMIHPVAVSAAVSASASTSPAAVSFHTTTDRHISQGSQGLPEDDTSAFMQRSCTRLCGPSAGLFLVSPLASPPRPVPPTLALRRPVRSRVPSVRLGSPSSAQTASVAITARSSR